MDSESTKKNEPFLFSSDDRAINKMFSSDVSTELAEEDQYSTGSGSIKEYIGKKFNDAFNNINSNVLNPVFVGEGRKDSNAN